MSTGKLRSKSHALQPTLHIGKEGMTPGVLDQLKQQLHRRKLVKVKVLPGLLKGKDKDAFAEQLALQVNARLVHRVGFVIVLAKR